MPVDDVWYLKERGSDGKRLPSAKYGRGRRYRVRWIDDAGRAREQMFDRKVDAERHDANMRSDVSRGVYVDPSAGRVTLKEYAEKWRSSRLHRESTAELVERALRRHVYPVLGALRMADVRPGTIQGWVKGRVEALEPSTLRVVYSYLVAMFGSAVRDRVIGVSPCQGIQLPEVPADEMFVPTVDQVYALSAALAGRDGAVGRYELLPVVAAGTGLRQGELWGLEVDKLDLDQGVLEVVQQLKVVSGRRPFLALPKTVQSRCRVELGAVVVAALRRHLEAFPPAEVEIEDETNPRKPVVRRVRLVFTNTDGRPIHRAGWSHLWKPAVERAGMQAGTGFHALRHYFATLLIHGGASVKTVQLALGHATPTITLNTYVGRWPEAIEATRVLVDNGLARSSFGPELGRGR